MHTTPIEWVFNPDGSRPGYVSNPLTGCLNGCRYCYARALANGRLRKRYLANPVVIPLVNYKEVELTKDPFYPRWWRKELEDVYKHKTPAGIFMCDMSDWLGDWVQLLFQREIIDYVRACTWHRFYMLTKQYHNLARFSPYPDNAYVGVTVDKKAGWEPAFEALNCIDARVTFISVEPFLEELPNLLSFEEAHVNWLIIGACTGTHDKLLAIANNYPGLTLMPWGRKWTLQPPVESIRELVAAADAVRLPIFLKNSLEPLLLHQEPLYWSINSLGFLRQELPVRAGPAAVAMGFNTGDDESP